MNNLKRIVRRFSLNHNVRRQWWVLLSFTATQNISFTFSRRAERETNELHSGCRPSFSRELGVRVQEPRSWKLNDGQKHLMAEDTRSKKWCCHMVPYEELREENDWHWMSMKKGANVRLPTFYSVCVYRFTPGAVVGVCEWWLKQILSM